MSESINFNSGLMGVRNGIESMQKAASEISNKGVGNTHDLAKSLVELKVSQLQVSASAEVVKAADDMIGTLLDIRA